MAQWCVLAATTDPELPSNERLTLFLVPMDREGIEVRPIASMLGPHHLNEVFLDRVRVGPGDVLGTVGGGWAVMRDALAYERVGIARYARCESLLARMLAVLEDDGSWEALAPALHARWVRALVDLRVAKLLAYRAVGEQSGVDPASAAAARIVTTTCDQAVAEILMEAAGGAALDAGRHGPLGGAIDDHWRYAQAATVASGTIEVQRILVARSVLGSSR
jgi:alkylation response protein AidB-like acyl-CoA dehydrogenase